jgi:purine nucleoside phosphorylase
MKVSAFSLVTNLAAGISDSPLDHNEVIEIAELSKVKLQTFMKEFLSQINISNN